jgi:hypothetical protein
MRFGLGAKRLDPGVLAFALLAKNDFITFQTLNMKRFARFMARNIKNHKSLKARTEAREMQRT